MKNLKHYQNIIKEKRKNTEFRDFLMEIASWATIVFYKNNGIISKFPNTKRTKKVITIQEFEKGRDDLIKKGHNYNFKKNFFENYKDLLGSIDIFNFIAYGGGENTEYSDMVLYSKNCYLSSTVLNSCENILYSFSIKDNCTDIINSMSVYQNSNIVYFCISIIQSFKIYYSKYIIQNI